MNKSNRSIIKKIGRHVVFPSIVGLGLERLGRSTSKNQILNLMYHGVYENNGDYFRAAHTPVSLFKKQIQYLRRHFDIISVEEAFEYYKKGKPLKRQSVTITFDDGFKNNLETALPILEQYRAPAIFYLSGVCLEYMKIRTLWSLLFNALYFFYPNADMSEFSATVANNSKKLFKYLQGNGVATERFQDYILQNFDIADKLNNTPKEGWMLLSKDEVSEMLTSEFVTIGSHGERHLMLSELNNAELNYELTQSRKKLMEISGKTINTIAFPFGGYNAHVKKMASEAGYDMQLAVNYKNNEDYQDKLIMSRYGVPTNTTFASTAFFINKAFARMGMDLLK